MIKINNLVKIYNENKHNECKALNGLSLEIKTGEAIAIIGKSGSGKSSLLHILSGIDSANSGEVLISNKDITLMNDLSLAKYRNKNIGIVLQDFFLIEECSVFDNVILPLNFTKMKKNDKIKRVSQLVHSVGLQKYMKNK